MLSNHNLKNKVAVITGEGSGLGRAAAFRLVSEGANVCLVDVNLDHVNKVKKQIMEAGGKALAKKCDINSSEDIKEGMMEAHDLWGHMEK